MLRIGFLLFLKFQIEFSRFEVLAKRTPYGDSPGDSSWMWAIQQAREEKKRAVLPDGRKEAGGLSAERHP
jgi:hypothetical protein